MATPGPGLPIRPTTFVGRERELDELAVVVEDAALVTLTGPGGIGKSRLAVELAHRLRERFPDGVEMVELAAVTDDGLVAGTVGEALGVSEEGGAPIAQMLVEELRDRRLLLVLDNCEHVAEACGALGAALVRACPRLRIVATSRRTLGVADEVVRRIPPLATPPDGAEPAEVTRFASVELFVDRAVRVHQGFRVTPDNADAVAAICRRIDGIPLAIELAAARVRILSAEQIAERLDRPLELLKALPGRAERRHETLRAVVGWSYKLLPEAHRRLFRTFSVFAGGCTLDGLEAVTGLAGSDLLESLEHLVDHSLVQVEHVPAGARYMVLETIRAFAADRLAEAGETEDVAARHIEWCTSVAESVGSEPDRQWLDRLEAEHENMRAALTRAAPDRALRLAVALAGFWSVRGHWAEGRRWLEASLGAAAETPLGVRALLASADLCRMQGDYDEAAQRYDRCLDAQHDPDVEARAVIGLGDIAMARGEVTGAEASYAAALALRTRLHDEAGAAAARGRLADVAQAAWDLDRARGLYEENLAAAKRTGDVLAAASVLDSLGRIELRRGNVQAARGFYEESLSIARSLGSAAATARALTSLGLVLWRLNDIDAARLPFEEALEIGRAIGDAARVAECQFVLGSFDAHRGETDAAASRLEESLALRRRSRAPQHVAMTLSMLGRVWSWRGSHDEAIELCREAVAIQRRLGNASGTAVALRDLGEVLIDASRHTEAATLLDESLDAWRATGDELLTADLLQLQGRVAHASGDVVRARELYARSLELHAGSGFDATRAAALRGLAALDLESGDAEAAHRSLTEALEIARRSGDVRGMRAASEALGRGVRASLRREGGSWTIRRGDAVVHVRDTKGMRYLAELLAGPGAEIRAVDMAAPRGRGRDDDLDRAEGRRRLAALAQEAQVAEAAGDEAAATRTRAQIDEIARRLGRSRRSAAGSEAEQARINVTKLIRGAIAKIAAHDPVLGHHLSRTVKTGEQCSYRPGPHDAVVVER